LPDAALFCPKGGGMMLFVLATGFSTGRNCMRDQMMSVVRSTVRVAIPVVGLAVLFGGLATPARATVVPEIDPGQLSSGLAMLVGGGLLLMHRLRR